MLTQSCFPQRTEALMNVQTAHSRKASADTALADAVLATRGKLDGLGDDLYDLRVAAARCALARADLEAALEAEATEPTARKSITVKAAAEELGVSTAYIRRLLRAPSGARLEGWTLYTEGGHPYRMYVYADSVEAYRRHLQAQRPTVKRGRFAA